MRALRRRQPAYVFGRAGTVLTAPVGLNNVGLVGLADLYLGILITDSDEIRPLATSVPGCSSRGMNREH
jgi:hypothetical protein